MAKRKSSRRAYLDSFTLTPDGKYEYSGEYMVLTGYRPKRRLAVCVVLSLVCAVSTIVCGCVPAPGMKNTFYVILPCALSIISSLSLLYGGIKMGFSGKLREYTYKESVGVMPLRGIVTALFSGVAVVCEAIVLIIDGSGGEALFAVVFILLHALSVLSGIAVKRVLSEMTWERRSR